MRALLAFRCFPLLSVDDVSIRTGADAGYGETFPRRAPFASRDKNASCSGVPKSRTTSRDHAKAVVLSCHCHPLLRVTLRYLVPLFILFVMTSIGAVTRQIAALEISSKQNTTTTTTTAAAKVKPAHQKQPSQTNVSKLLTKFAAPNVPKPAPKPILKHKASSSKIPTSQSTTATTTTTAAKSKQTSSAAQPEIDIGRYDGGFEIENETRGQVVHGEAAKQLALDSSILGSVPRQETAALCSRISQCATYS